MCLKEDSLTVRRFLRRIGVRRFLSFLYLVSVNGRYECKQCHKTYTSYQGLCNHKKSVHMGVRYPCDQCDYQATMKTSLTLHIQAQHEGVKYACEKCDNQFSYQSNLTKHIQSEHEGVKFHCMQCDYQAKHQSALSQHIKTKHEDESSISDPDTLLEEAEEKFDKCSLKSKKNDKSDDEFSPSEKAQENSDISDNIPKQVQPVKEYIFSVNGKYECKQCQKTYCNNQSLKKHSQSMMVLDTLAISVITKLHREVT